MTSTRILLAAVLLANGAAAYPVMVNNHSFELPATADGVINNASGVTAWTYSGAGSPGIFNPSASQSHYTGMGNADPNGGVLPNMVGPGMGFMFPGNGNTGEFSQTLAAALQANTTYTLTVAIGHRNYFNNAQVPKDFRIALVTATTQTVVAEFIADVRSQNPLNLTENTTGTITLTQSTFTDFSASTTTGTSPAGLGEPLVIRIQSLANGRYLDIDNVRLDASPASAGSAPVLIDWSTAAAVANPAGDGKRWNSLGTPNINNVPQPLTPTQLINSTGAASGISVAVSFGTTTNSSGSGFGGTAIAGPEGADPFDETNAVNDGIYVNSNTVGGDSTATISFSGLASSAAYDFSAIGGRASNGVNGRITIVTGTSANSTYDLLNNGTLRNFSVTSNASGVIVLNFREIDPNNNSANAVFKAMSISPQNEAPAAIASFSANRSYVQTGNPVTLSWSASGYDTLVLNPGGINAAALGTAGIGSTAITVNAPTTFTLTATKGAVSTSHSVTVFAGPPRPNIVLFLVDDMGIHDTSVPLLLDGTGQPKSYNFNSFYKTPNMETLASTGMRFTTAYAQSVCSPTRCGLLTGRTSARHGVTDWIGANDPGSPPNWRVNGFTASEVTLPKQLQAVGYRTIHCGKAHFGPSGFDVRTLGFDVNIAGNHLGQPTRYIGAGGYGVPGLGAYDSTTTFLTKALTLEANKALTTAVGQGAPFFLNMSFYAVHSPFTTNPDATGNYSGAVGGSGGNHAKFATMIEGMDIAVGQIRQKLIDLGVAENTLIVFLGDNGSDSPATTQDGLPTAPFNDWPMRGKKGSKWEGGTRVPFIATWALRNATNPFQQAVPIPANSIETDIVATWDVPATLLDLVDLPSPANFGGDSHSLLPYLSGVPGTHRPQEIVVHYPHEHRSDFFSWIRQGNMKLIYNFQNNTHQLYNLATDPTETTNRAASQPDEVMRLARRLAQKLDSEWGPAGVLLPVIASTAPPGNVVSIPNQGAIDLDQDGIDDRNEDPNLNGLVDPGETDPDNDNSDGDRTLDGDELRTGTDPLNASSDFIGTLTPAAGASRTITWPSKPGAIYRIETSTTLTAVEWDWIADDVPAHAQNASTTYLLPHGTDPARFYRVRLK